MNKKLIAVGTSLIVGGALLFTTAFASASQFSGYEAYKEAVKNTAKAKNMTFNVDMTLKDGSSNLISVTSTTKANHQGDEAVSSKIVVSTNNEKKTLETYVQDGKSIMKTDDTDVYKVMEHDKINSRRQAHNRMQSHHNDEEAMRVGEMIVDSMVGDMKNYFVLDEKADGTSEVSFNLSENRIPAVVNAVVALGVKNASKHEFKHNGPHDIDIKPELPKLVEDVRLENVDLKAVIGKDKYFQKQTVSFVLKGKDESGKNHEIAMSIDMSLSDINRTITDKVDLTDKKVEVVKKEDFERMHRDRMDR